MQGAHAERLPATRPGVRAGAHRDAPSAGCPLPALASDMPRQPAGVRRTYTDGAAGPYSTVRTASSRAASTKRRSGAERCERLGKYRK